MIKLIANFIIEKSLHCPVYSTNSIILFDLIENYSSY